MLSINIPVYNYDITTLVKQLHKQASNLSENVEIRVYDDGSDVFFKEKNKAIASLPEVVYIEMSKNLGRAAIRNKLGFDSKFDLLLFIDADSKIVNKSYLKNYLNNYKPGRILCGGTTYSEKKPEDSSTLLRWFYGINREAVSAQIRNRHKGFIITSNNFLIEKKVFNKVHFRKELEKYGHEDTLLGYDLFQSGFEIYHIENPLEHIGLEDSHSFLTKTRQALDNLFFINKKMLNNDSVFNEQVNFLKKYNRIIKFIPKCFFSSIYHLFHKKLEANLCGKKPKLFFFDLYKLGYYATKK